MGGTEDDGGDSLCKICKYEVKDHEHGLLCEGKCQSWYHITCLGISSQLYKKMYGEILKILIWMCPSCKKQLKQLMELETCADKMKTLCDKFANIEGKVNSISESVGKSFSKPTYSQVAICNKQFSVAKPVNMPNLIIKPKNKQDLQKSKQDMEKIKPVDIGVRINTKKELSNGKILLKFPSESDMEKMRDTATKVLGKNYEIIQTTLRNPQIRIPGFVQDYSENTVESMIKKQNPIIGEEHFKVTYIKSFKTKKYKTVYAECSPKLFHLLMERKKIYMGWERFPVYENISILKCFKCQQFNHKFNDCPNKPVCCNCAGEHDTKECVSRNQKPKCKNCESANKKYSTGYDIYHKANDEECSTYKYRLDSARSRINYG
ncbi:unnamed protein product [Acanthoscelides obtectus]|uniref:PHD-type domain-containing protein n=1 Tax=Acanthoscelides obtectus TaxID=200917 RepID=A0A9P0MI63_ACAOB|nr:unnamed protein product [Acanthoscelides obtectus]CAK1625113.1 hypothetical protein AOBTE_LOCUS2963 [Acanthoscelides obtectus]